MPPRVLRFSRARALQRPWLTHALLSIAAQVGGISLGEINALEVEFLTRLSFRLHVLPEEFEATCARLCSELTSEDMADAPPEQAGAEAGRGGAQAGYVAAPGERGGKAYAAQAVA